MATNRDSTDTIISQTEFYGGMGTDNKVGIQHSYADSEGLDTRKSPGAMTSLPRLTKMSGSDLNGTITAITQSPDGIRWAITDRGTMYAINKDDTLSRYFSAPGWGDPANGDIIYWPPKDSLYITGAERVYCMSHVTKDVNKRRFLEITGSRSTYPTVDTILQRDRDDKWIGSTVKRLSFKNGNDAYTTKSELSEADVDKCIFLPDQSPMTRVGVQIKNKPVDSTLTLIVHDAGNNEMARASVTDRTELSGNVVYFDFAPSVYLEDYANHGSEYHFHLISDKPWEVYVYEAGRMYGLHFEYYASMLMQTNSRSHPIIGFSNRKLLIGNGCYIADWLPSGKAEVDYTELSRHRVMVERDTEVTSLTTNDEYAVAGCERVGEDKMRSPQGGSIVFWDGDSAFLNFKIDTPMGAPKSLYTYQNMTYVIINGALYVYTGNKALTKIRTIRDSQSEFSGKVDSTDVYSHMMTIRRGILLVGYPSKTTIDNMRHGVYSYGSIDKNYPNSFYFSYSLPDGKKYNAADERLSIGGVWNFNDTLYVSYSVTTGEKTTSYLGKVDNSSLPAPESKYESLEYDASMPWKAKELMRLVATFDTLPKGYAVKLKYKLDGKEWQYCAHSAGAGDTILSGDVNKRFRTAQFGVDVSYNGNELVPIRITSVGADVRPLQFEGKMHI